jgi:hypothetical protein
MPSKSLKRTYREGHKNIQTGASTSTSLLMFFVLVFVLSVPLWVLGATNLVALPKDTPLYVPNVEL